ncbi:ParB N-terminal domain-containing protein [Roseibium album]|uniref:ParB N-terminal domain-containing protein n=1 Tax=Roseibium album TaxID=311410 RepID=UPI003919B4C3
MTKWRSIEALHGLAKGEVAPGPAPILQWIKIKDLVIDDSYQRPLERKNWSAIRMIAKDFSWSKFSPVFIAPVEGGKFAIIDGQHRTHAAAACGFEQVPCQIVQMNHAEQAAAFAAVNGNVTQVTAFQVFKAALAAGEEWAIHARDIAEKAGCRLMTRNSSTAQKKPGEIYSIKVFRSLVEKYDDTDVVTALSIMMRTEGLSEIPEFWAVSFLRPLIDALCQRREAMSREGFETKLADLDLWLICDQISADNRERQRNGEPTLVSSVQMEFRILEWIDEHFPPRKLIAAPGKAA